LKALPSPFEAPSKPLRSQEKEKEKEQEQEQIDPSLERDRTLGGTGGPIANGPPAPAPEIPRLGAAGERTDQISLGLPASGAARTPRARRRAADPFGTRIAPDWQPKPETLAAFREIGVDAAKHLPEFVDYWLGVPGADGRKVDWEATFRKRIRDLIEHGRAHAWKPPRAPPVALLAPPPLTPEEHARRAAVVAKLDELRDAGKVPLVSDAEALVAEQGKGVFWSRGAPAPEGTRAPDIARAAEQALREASASLGAEGTDARWVHQAPAPQSPAAGPMPGADADADPTAAASQRRCTAPLASTTPEPSPAGACSAAKETYG
jgi:hypothetical protein